MRTILYVASLGAAALLMAGCATTPPASEAPADEETAPAGDTTDTGPATTDAAERAVARRGRERWDYIFSVDYDKAYDYLSPAYRDRMTRTEYIVKMAAQHVRWTAADFQEVTCEPDLCLAKWVVTWRYNIPVKGAGTYEGEKPLAERWILAGGEWYFVPPV